MHAFVRPPMRPLLALSGSHFPCSVRASSRLAKLQKTLEEGPGLGEFVKSPPGSASGPAQGPRKRFRQKPLPKPSWLKVEVPQGPEYLHLKQTVRKLKLATVCEEARCPNIGECWGGHDGIATATIMIMGDTCTRGCSFCAVKTSRAPPPLDPEEPENVATAVTDWGLDYVVLTSVDRDDLEDQGADHFARTVEALKRRKPDILVECLTPDFSGQEPLVQRVALSGLDVFAHNLETVERLTRRVRDYRAGYRQSLRVLEAALAARPSLVTKTSIMLGVGERDDEVRQTLRDARDAGVQVVTFGQYLRPSKGHMPVQAFVEPAKFEEWQHEAEAMGYTYVASGPLVRSSYRAGEFFMKAMLRERAAAASVAAQQVQQQAAV
mmetsp:Transcript_8151/g.25635  ORF Transcript_8151/g.25635 Transcript_8151/m.25635 type:complete len:380 (+) Transcript_8151:8-1147(+)